ncbi:MAG: extracellular catalytic domain type 1 short-chain-length polyhydroxyalkanoate depolymerase [Pseudobdellovibrio sp.]
MKIFFAGFILVAAFQLHADEKKGWLREKIKERIVKRLEEQPAPEADSDTSKKIEKPGTYTFTIKQGVLDRYYMVHVPSGYSASKPVPLVVALHGGGGDMNIQATDEYYKFISKSDSAGFIAAFPNGFSHFKSGKLATWNAGKCCGDARDQKIDDVGFLKTVIEKIQKQLSIDSKRIFATGMSNGGIMAYRLACDMSETFRAIAPVAGTDNTTECKPVKAVSILHIHAQDDDHVLFNGGAGKPFGGDASKVTDFNSVPNTIEKWVKMNACEAKPQNVLKIEGASCEKYSKCKENSEIELCVTTTGGHSWPGGKKPRGMTGVAVSKAISATDMMWQFFSSQK